MLKSMVLVTSLLIYNSIVKRLVIIFLYVLLLVTASATTVAVRLLLSFVVTSVVVSVLSCWVGYIVVMSDYSLSLGCWSCCLWSWSCRNGLAYSAVHLRRITAVCIYKSWSHAVDGSQTDALCSSCDPSGVYDGDGPLRRTPVPYARRQPRLSSVPA